MLEKKLIPTPLFVKTDHWIESGPVVEPLGRSRFLFFFFLLCRVIWHQIMARIQGPNSKYTPQRLATIVRSAVERLGGLWIKAAQIIAMRRDIFNPQFCDEIARVRDHAQGFSGEEAKKIIEMEVGRPVVEIFKEFDVVPVAVTSLGQVHIAYLQDSGKKVAIKVQRPGIAESFSRDLTFVALYIKLIRLFRVRPWGRWQEMFSALQGTLAEELDYRIEAKSMRHMRRSLAPDKIHVPRVYSKYSKRRVLVMEFIDGVLVSDYIQAVTENPKLAKQWCKENAIKPKKLGKRLFLSFLRQLLDDDMVHGDLHPSNIMMLRKSRFCFIDYGSVGTLDGAIQQKVRSSFKALARRNHGKYFDTLLTLVPGLPDVDINTMRAEVIRELKAWEELADEKNIPYEQRALTGLDVRLSAISNKYRLPPFWGMLRITRTTTALDASLRFLIPEVDFSKLVREHFKRQRQRLRESGRSKEVDDEVK